MKKKNEEKNSLNLQLSNLDEGSIIGKIYRYFYSLFQERKEFNPFVKYFQFLVEGLQIISYAFSDIHENSWADDHKKYQIIEYVRISTIMKYFNHDVFEVVFYFLFFVIVIYSLFILLHICFIDSTSKIYQLTTTIVRSSIDIIAVILYVGIMEIFLIPIKCVDGRVYGVKDDFKCGGSAYYLHLIVGIFGVIWLFLWSLFVLSFSFYPFQNSMSTIRINSYNDIVVIIIKFIFALQNILITNQYLSLGILLLFSIFVFFKCFNETTYNNKNLEVAVTLRNFCVVWTYFVLLISKLLPNKGYIFLLIFGYILIIYLSYILIKEKEFRGVNFSNKKKNLKDCITKIKLNIRLINSFIESKNNRNANSIEDKRNIILLKGNIKAHCNTCTSKDCPLVKFINNEGNFNIQKQSILNYMNCYFNRLLKEYPNNFNLLILFVHFNYSKRFNLNNVKANLNILKNMQCNFKEKYIIYCLEQNMKNNRDSGLDINIERDRNNDSRIDLTEQKYQKLKYLIENSIKLYGEFWGIFSTNVTNNINTSKLYSLGEKLNIYLREMNILWDTELKNEKIHNEHQSIVNLYSKFFSEILWDQKKSKEIYKKLNEENLNNFRSNKNKKIKEENIRANIEELVDNQDLLLFCECDEKGNCKIIQYSACLSNIVAYQKIDLIGRPLDIILPNLIIDDFKKYLEDGIKKLHLGQNNQSDLSFRENQSSKNIKLILIKDRIGYIFPLLANCKILDDNDYSDTFLLKMKFENKDNKFEYASYVLTNSDLIVENISSSAINLGLSLDLLKKYMVKIDLLIRTDNEIVLNIYERIEEYEEEPKEVTWIYPDVIYPKDNVHQNKEEEIEELVEKSRKKEILMQVKAIKFNEGENFAFIFKFMDFNTKSKKKKIDLDLAIPKSNNNLVMFDLLKLNYIRTQIVPRKSGLRNLRSKEEEELNFGGEKETKIIELKKMKMKKKKKKIEFDESDDVTETEDLEKNEAKIFLTKEKIIELQVSNYIDIKNFIFSLPTYGTDVSLERFRPNGDKYSASKITESLIKILISKFIQKVDEKFNVDMKRKKNKSLMYKLLNTDTVQVSSNNYLLEDNDLNFNEQAETTGTSQGEEINKGLMVRNSSPLANVFKSNSMKKINILIDIIFLGTFTFLLCEFLITNNHFAQLKKKINYLKNGYVILNDIVYIKYFVSEGVIRNLPMMSGLYSQKENDDIIYELTRYRQEFAEVYDTFITERLCDEYHDYMKYTNVTIYTSIYTSTELQPKNLSLLFDSIMSRISSSINNLVSLTSSSLLLMTNRDTYELMYNLINEYYINWRNVVHILLDDAQETTKKLKTPLIIIFSFYFIFSIAMIIASLKLLAKFSLDREKPINLFLTIKKGVFENLKNCAENFSNKLLNKFFGNDDKEEESQQEYQTNIKPSDINIVKFKAASNNSSIKKSFAFFNLVIMMIIFLIIYFIYFILKCFNYFTKMSELNKFISLYQKNCAAEVNIILSIDIIKSYLYNKSIPILSQTNTHDVFISYFLNISYSFSECLFYGATEKALLGKKYLEKYLKYQEGDFSELLDENFAESVRATNYIKYGLKPIEARVFEIIRYLTIKYFNSTEADENYIESSELLRIENRKFYEVHSLIKNIFRQYYQGISNLMMESFNEYKSDSNLIYIVIFICLIFLIVFYYLIVWKLIEQKLEIILKNSIDLINLIPQEIKNIIVEKLNE